MSKISWVVLHHDREKQLILSAHQQKKIDHTVQKAMEVWNIPGLALVIVKNDKVLSIKGYGFREVGKPDSVDEHTIFGAASLTKAFTATAIGLLVNEGKLAWDDPVTEYIPTFKMFDSHATKLITIRDLLCHRCGLGTNSGDTLLYSNYSSEDVVRRIQYIPPEYSFRAGFGYSSLMYTTAGLLISTVSGMSWDEYIRRRIFEPLGMTNSVTNARYLENHSNIATPHEIINGNLQTVAYRQDARLEAAASICTSVSDIALWLRLQLNKGCVDGNQIVDPAIIAETQTPHTPIMLTPFEKKLLPSQHFSTYGLGWFLSDLYGRSIVGHIGDLDGMLSNIILIPEEKIGIAVFSNKKPNNAYNAVPYFIIDTLLGITPHDYIQPYIDFEKEEREKAEQTKKHLEEIRSIDFHPSLSMEEFSGTYESTILGKATVCIDEDRFRIKLQAHETMRGTLQHWHYDTFLCKWDDPVLGESLIPFISNGQGKIVEFRLKICEDYLDSLEHEFRKTT